MLNSVMLITIIVVATLIAYYFLSPSEESWFASIVDQLAIQKDFAYLTREFNTSCTSLLNASSFTTKYYTGEEITVNFYKDLPSKAGKIVVLRAHSAVRNNSVYVDLFTSEPFVRGKHEEIGDQLSRGIFLYPPNDEFFAINPTFVQNQINPSMRGAFDKSLIIMMGCDSLNETTMAEALVSRGAKVIIGWTRKVDLADSDNSTLRFLSYVLAENPYTIGAAVSTVNSFNHSFGAQLDFYPKNDEIRNYILPTGRDKSLGFAVNSFQFLLLPLYLRKRR